MTVKKIDEATTPEVAALEGTPTNEATDQTEVTAEEKSLERQIVAQEKSLRQQLDDMPKVKLTIPEDQNNPDDVVPIIWNGITFAVPRGIEFDVPEVIRDIWQESYSKTQAVNRRIRESVKKEIKIL